MQPLVSVIMSTYNREDLVKEAVFSVLNQSFENFEFIVIDDNSTDNTIEILKNFKDKRLKVFKNRTNCGCTFNYHNAQNLANGEYIAHIDDDDIWLKDKLEKQVAFIEENSEIVLLGSFIETFGENARPSWVFDTNSDKLAFLMNFYNPICHSAIIYRKNFMLKNGINYDIWKKCSQDYDFYRQILEANGKLSNLPEILVRYRMHKKRITDIKETQNIQIYNAENTKKALLSKFLNDEEIIEITELMHGFPFNEYNIPNILTAIEKAFVKYGKKYGIDERILEEVKNDIIKGLYRF